ncbi:extracellular solute-binding protein [Streptomyces sp. E5N91]|uniref:extracellular solute-binding protein n=1 Tax=Streptomyces sp. E5N91 TaxID=1851996 RepID=UPI000EF5CD2B|nr:extracellular solute-binding protein [Streptomyces sp. E5N91]
MSLLTAGAASLALLATACGGSGAGGSSSAPENFDYLSVTENTTVKTALTTMSKDVCKAANDALPLKVETVPQASLDQKLQLLAGQDALPVQFAAGNAPALTQQLAKSGKVADLEAKLKELGVLDQLEPAAVSTIKALYGGELQVLPYEYNIEGIFYNKKVFDKYDIKVPTTWAEYLDAARDLHKADPKAYITADNGDAGFATSMLWQAGSRPYTVDGTKVKIDFSDQGAKTFTGTWQQLIDEKLLASVPAWTDEWYKGLGDGSIATLATGAWMPANLESGAKSASGDWRVAPMPQWKAGDKVSAENGGSALALPELGKNEALAYAFVEYANAGDGVQTRLKNGAFPATTADLQSTRFQDTAFPYFGGQKANKIFAESAADVPDDWSYLPYQVYANSVFNDTVGKAYVSGTTLAEGLESWQEASVKYGEEQGFTVEK